ncbi:MAG TPA: ribosome biogenesis GTP-binding protein YihA/YsxC [Nitrospiria bacterium]
MKIRDVEFVLSCRKVEDCPGEDLPEVAIVGRSNVGKSSLINDLVRRKGIARVSGTPGKTRLLNFFRVTLTGSPPRSFFLVDLPGYGYAKVSKAEQAGWGEMIENYLTARTGLRTLIVLIDIRRDLGIHDRQLISWVRSRGIPILFVATKADKISRGKRQGELARLKKALSPDGGPSPELISFSALSGEGRERLLDCILARL